MVLQVDPATDTFFETAIHRRMFLILSGPIAHGRNRPGHVFHFGKAH